MYAHQRSPNWCLTDKAIAVMAKAQREDGYIYTKAIIGVEKTGNAKLFDDKLSLKPIISGIWWRRAQVFTATGKTTLLKLPKKRLIFWLVSLQNGQCRTSPQRLMSALHGLVGTIPHDQWEAVLICKHLINIVALPKAPTIIRTAFRFAQAQPYAGIRCGLRTYAGVADVYAETGEDSLIHSLNLICINLTQRKMYVTGACGALFDGVSPYGTLQTQRRTENWVHPRSGVIFQLPNASAHNETCANILNVLFNHWRNACCRVLNTWIGRIGVV